MINRYKMERYQLAKFSIEWLRVMFSLWGMNCKLLTYIIYECMTYGNECRMVRLIKNKMCSIVTYKKLLAVLKGCGYIKRVEWIRYINPYYVHKGKEYIDKDGILDLFSVEDVGILFNNEDIDE